MISRDCGDEIDLNSLELYLPLDSNVASDQPDEAVQRVGGLSSEKSQFRKGGAKVPEFRMKVAPDTVAYADGENLKLVVEFAIPGAPTDTIDVKILEDSVHLTAPARDIEYVASLALGWPVKPDKAEATYEHGLLRIEVPFKDPMEDAVKVAIKAG
ncbi:MAG: Hsp20/alpha crystallin family protein, partial [Isosphaeraceae bacterium]